MNLARYVVPVCLAMTSLSFADEAPGQKPLDQKGTVAQAVAAAEKLAATLDDAQKEKFFFEFGDRVQRRNWSNLPEGIVHRAGLRWGDLNEAQRAAVMELLSATLSAEGQKQVRESMQADETLRRPAAPQGGQRPGGPGGARGGGANFGEDQFFVSILGKPSATEPWMLQFGGHHLAINVTIVDDQMTLSPSLTGGQPMNYEVEGKSVQQMASERERASKFVASLKPEQLDKAVLGDRPATLAFGPGVEDAKPKGEGLRATDLDETQRTLLVELIASRVGVLNEVQAAATMKKIEADLERTWFAWFGPVDGSGPASYRIQSPSVLIEYVPQQMGGNAANHVHAMYRDPSNDYGAGWAETAR